MGASDNKAVVRRMFDEVVNNGRTELIDELFDPAFTSRTPQGEMDREGFKAFVAAWRSAFPDIRCEVSDLTAEDDRVAWAVRATGTHRGDFNGIPATGRRVDFDSLNIGHFRAGKALRHTVLMDLQTMMEQLGVAVAAAG
jgi:steroid delta-isomerase-like uncharacterized protein